MNVIFFGSTSDSVKVLEKLLPFNIVGVVTQPSKPVGRAQKLTPTPVETWAKENNITVLSFPSDATKPWLYQDEEQVIDTLGPLKADILISASYGQKIPLQSIQSAQFGGLNVHPSLLPRWRGADPVPWAILSGDHQTGVTIVTLSDEFDQGTILAQKKIAIKKTDFSNPLRTKLFEIGAELLIASIPDVRSYLTSDVKRKLSIGKTQTPNHLAYARRLTRDDGYEAWETIDLAMKEGLDAERIERKFRALTPWPGVWTIINQTNAKRLKILSAHLKPPSGNLVLTTVQLEGKNPVSFAQFQRAYLISSS